MSQDIFGLQTPDIRANILRDLGNVEPSQNLAIDSDAYIRASATGNAIEGLYAGLQYLIAQLMPDTANDEYVRYHAANYGLQPLPATSAEGQITITGTPGTILPSGTLIKRNKDACAYITSASATIAANSSAQVAAQAAQAASLANCLSAEPAAITTAVAGIDSATTITVMQGGTDEEGTEHLRQRLLERLRTPPAGGNVNDYRVWAKEVPGVEDCYVMNLRRGPGTVDLVLLGQNAVPSQSVINAVRTHIAEQRPAGLPDMWIGTPTMRTVDFRIALAVESGALADYQQKIQALLQVWFAAQAPATVFVKSQAEALISSIAGITDRELQLPAANVIPRNDAIIEWLLLGNVEVVAL